MNDFGQWRSTSDGTATDGMCIFETKVDGYTGFGARVVYVVDSGDWGYCNIFLDFDSGNPVDLTQLDISGVRFKMQGSPFTSFNLQLGTSLAEYNWKYYHYKLEPTDEWTTVTVRFDEFESDDDIPYSLSQAMQSATSLVWENSNVAQGGWFTIDNIDFLVSASIPEPSKNQQEELTSSSKAVAPSVFTVLLMSIGLMQWR